MTGSLLRNHQLVITGFILLVASTQVPGVMIKNSIGGCLTYTRGLGQQATGQLVNTATCNSSDLKQTSWVVTNLATNGGYSPYQFCINATTLCVGVQLGPKAAPPINRIPSVNLKLVANDTTDDGQKWFALDTASLPNHYVNGWTGSCLQSYSLRNTTRTRRCTNKDTQRWYIVN